MKTEKQNDYVMVSVVQTKGEVTSSLAATKKDADVFIQGYQWCGGDNETSGPRAIAINGFLVKQVGSAAFPKGHEKTDKTVTLAFPLECIDKIEITELYQEDEEE